jgi:hypothetical protein
MSVETPKPGVVIVLRQKDDLTEGEPPYAPAFYEAIGRVVTYWGRLEQQLDMILRICINVAAQEGIQETMSSIALERKLDSLKRLFRDCKSLNPMRDQARHVFSQIKVGSNDRHLIIHSNWDGFVNGPPPKIKFINVKHGPDDLKIKRFESDLPTLQMLYRSIDEVSMMLIPISAFVASRQDNAKLRKAQEQHLAGELDEPPIPL